ncbi:MAG: TonB family protein [Bacteroidales bacterium]
MPSILIYLFKSTIAFLALYGLYLLLLKKNQQFEITRFYLIFTVVFAALFPFIKFIDYKIIEIPVLDLSSTEIVNADSVIDQNTSLSFWNIINLPSIATYLYLIVGSLILIHLLYLLIRFAINISKHSRFEILHGKKVIVSNCWNQTFSFFGIIVLPEKDFVLKENLLLLKHELVHVKQLHTLDLLLAELFQVIHWFNPFAYSIKKEMREVHEYLADLRVVEDGINKYAYQQLLLEYLTNSVTPRVSNTFSAKLLKKRFAMMTKNKAPKIILIRYLLAIPIVAMLIGLMSFEKKIQYVEKQATPTLKENYDLKNQHQNSINKVVSPKSTSNSFIEKESKKQQNPESIEEMTKRLKSYAANETELKLFQIDSKNPGSIITIFKKGVVYKIYLVGEHKDETMKRFVAPQLESKENAENILLREINCAKGYSTILFSCKETGVYNLTIPNKDEGENYLIGLYLKEIVEEEASGDFKVKIVEAKNEKKNTSINEDDAFVVVDNMPKFNNKGIDAAREYIAQNLKYPDIAAKKGIQGRVYVSFVVEKDGSVSNTKIVRSVDPILDEEVLRVVNNMPKWTPGSQNGKTVRVKFTIPAIFNLNNKSQDSKGKDVSTVVVDDYEPFVVVEVMPKFEDKDDMSTVYNYITQNIQYPSIAKEKGIQGKVYVSFVTEEDGRVSNVKVERGVDPILDKEALKVIESMPKWTPGYQRGKAVRVKFTIPVSFKSEKD